MMSCGHSEAEGFQIFTQLASWPSECLCHPPLPLETSCLLMMVMMMMTSSAMMKTTISGYGNNKFDVRFSVQEHKI